jgi:hypothetical protein
VAAVIKSPPFIRTALIWLKRQLPSLDPKDLLPIGIDATQGAIVCGNGSTPDLLVAEFSQAHGTFGIVQARSKFDFYKQILSFKFQKALIRCVENEEFQNSMTTTGRVVQEHLEASRFVSNPCFLLRHSIVIQIYGAPTTILFVIPEICQALAIFTTTQSNTTQTLTIHRCPVKYTANWQKVPQQPRRGIAHWHRIRHI